MKETFLAILKICCFLLVLPLIATSFIAFQSQILSLSVKKEVWVLWGAGSYVALNLFVYDFKSVYISGKSLIEKLFAFFKPAGYVVPIYSIVLIIVYVIASALGIGASLRPYLLFFIAFTFAMHLILTANEIYESDKSILKAHYLLAFGAIFIVNVVIISLLLAWAIPEYSLVVFIKSLASQTSHLYKSVYRTLFLDSSV
ncbi:MAG: hypothetical protein HQL12_05820 [Candidatus Omnitrophica bacterium]|nr:hypothetical protein [Candidatus Omnitrophota bacterium]